MQTTLTPRTLSPVSHLIDGLSRTELSPGWQSPPHLHHTAELILCLSGSLSVSVCGGAQWVLPGEYLLIFPNLPHEMLVSAQAPCSILQLHCSKAAFYQAHASDSRAPAPLLSELSAGRRRFLHARGSFPQLRACLEGLQAELAAPTLYNERMIQLYLEAVETLLSRALAAAPPQAALYSNQHLLQAVSYVDQHYMERIRVQDVARAAGISDRYLSTLFHQCFHLSVSAYLTYVRVSRSIDGKSSRPDYPLAQLALDVGFSSQQHFSKVFQQVMGMSPKKYFSIAAAAP